MTCCNGSSSLLDAVSPTGFLLRPSSSDGGKPTAYLFVCTVLGMLCQNAFRSVEPTEQVTYR